MERITIKELIFREGKDSFTISSFGEDFQNHNGNPSNIKSICCDMSPSYISGISKELPNTEITFYKFHVMKVMNEGVNEVRLQEQKKIRNSKIPNSYGLQKRKI